MWLVTSESELSPTSGFSVVFSKHDGVSVVLVVLAELVASVVLGGVSVGLGGVSVEEPVMKAQRRWRREGGYESRRATTRTGTLSARFRSTKMRQMRMVCVGSRFSHCINLTASSSLILSPFSSAASFFWYNSQYS